MLLRWYLGSRGRRRVFGRWKDTRKDTLFRVLREECEQRSFLYSLGLGYQDSCRSSWARRD